MLTRRGFIQRSFAFVGLAVVGRVLWREQAEAVRYHGSTTTDASLANPTLILDRFGVYGIGANNLCASCAMQRFTEFPITGWRFMPSDGTKTCDECGTMIPRAQDDGPFLRPIGAPADVLIEDLRFQNEHVVRGDTLWQS